jgi:hypothetical protein
MFRNHVSEVAFQGQQIWDFFGHWRVEAHIRGNAQVSEIELKK